MKKLTVIIMAGVLLLLVACGGGGDEIRSAICSGSDEESIRDEGIFTEMMVEKEVALAPAFAMLAPAPMATPAPAVVRRVAVDAQAGGVVELEVAERKIISTASLIIQVEEVQQSLAEVRLIAESLGGFVEQLASSGRPEQQRATVTIRVSQDQFFNAVGQIEALGELQSQTLGSEDVSERFIDLEARLKSALREEESLLSLLQRASTVSEILTIERELARVRSEIERFQGQLNFLQRRVDLATITVTLIPPEEVVGEPPFASLAVEVSNVRDSVATLKHLVSSKNGELDSVFLPLKGGKASAEISLRVFAPDFDGTVAELEREGELARKELREGKPSDPEVEPPKKPHSRIDVRFVEVEAEGSNTVLIVAIAAPIGGVAFLALMGALLYFAHRAGRRQVQG